MDFSLQLDGDCTVGGGIAYVPQNPWIQNLPLKENVVFGETYDQDKYNATIDACALRFDLGILPKVHTPVLFQLRCLTP
jgi:ATP-binding cassette, subfamily C (CFTR/MRP), member 1